MQSEIEVVCAAVLHGFPRSLQRPFTAGQLIRYANAARPPARRAAVSLSRMEPLGDARALSSLDAAWSQAEGLYAAIGALSRNRRALPGLGQQLEVRQAELAGLAQTYHLPACGPAGR